MAGRTALGLDAYCALPHVLVAPTGHDVRGLVDRALAAQGRARCVRVSVPSFFAAAELVRRSDDVATLPERPVRLYDGALLALAPPLPVPGFTIAAAWHERADREPALAWVRAVPGRGPKPMRGQHRQGPVHANLKATVAAASGIALSASIIGRH